MIHIRRCDYLQEKGYGVFLDLKSNLSKSPPSNNDNKKRKFEVRNQLSDIALENHPLQVMNKSSHNKVNKGDIVFTEIPIETVPLLFSKLCVLTCGVCLTPLGPLTKRAIKLLSLSHTAPVLTTKEKKQLDSLWRQLLKLQTQQTHYENDTLCCTGCLENVCSSMCLKALDQQDWHRIVCPRFWGSGSELFQPISHENFQLAELTTSQLSVITAWKSFVAHSSRYFEGFLLAGRLLCRIISCSETSTKCQVDCLKKNLLTYTHMNSDVTWAIIHSNRICLSNNNDNLIEKKRLIESFESQCQDSFKLLIQFFIRRQELLQRQLAIPITQCVDYTFFDHLLIQFERVNSDVSLEDPIIEPLLKLAQEGQVNSCKSIFQALRHVIYPTLPSTDKIEENITDTFIDILGYSYCQIVGFLNHSCEPNVRLEFIWNKDFTMNNKLVAYKDKQIINRFYQPYNQLLLPTIACVVRALRSINNGEELTISYLDETLPLAIRSRTLKQIYGFICRCPKCKNEAAQMKQDRSNAKIL